MGAQRRKRPRALTLTLPDDQQPYLVLDGAKLTLRNFSEEGMGLWVATPAPFGLHKGNTISGDIVIGNHIHSVRLEVVHQTKKVIGLRIQQKSEELQRMFSQLLEPVRYAHALKPNSESGNLDKETGHSRLWYEGPSGTELLVWYNELQRLVLAIQLCWVGRWVIRHQFQAPQTGILTDDTRYRRGGVVREEELILRHPAPDAETMTHAGQFVAAVNPPLPGHLFWQFLETGEQVYLPEDFLKNIKVA